MAEDGVDAGPGAGGQRVRTLLYTCRGLPIQMSDQDLPHTTVPPTERICLPAPPPLAAPRLTYVCGRWRMYRSMLLDTSPIYPLAIHVGHSLFCITSFREWRTGQTKTEPSWMHNLVCSYFCFGFGPSFAVPFCARVLWFHDFFGTSMTPLASLWYRRLLRSASQVAPLRLTI